MAKAMYVGVGGVARKIKKMYVGVGGVARKIKKMYVGVGGVARCIFSSSELTYVGELTNLGSSRMRMGAVSTAAHAIFAGGISGTTYKSDTDAYNTSLVSVSASIPALSAKRSSPSTLTVGGSALIAGGASAAMVVSSVVDSYNTSLVRSTLSALSRARYQMLCVLAGTYGIFAGGTYVYLSTTIKTAAEVDYYTDTLVKGTLSSLSTPRRQGAGAPVGEYGLIAGGGDNSDNYSQVDAYNNSTLVCTTISALSSIRYMLAGAPVGGFALFAGGSSASDTSAKDTVDVYNTSLVKTTGTNLQSARYLMAGVGLTGFALFLGGRLDSANFNAVDVYNDSLVRTNGQSLPSSGEWNATKFGAYCVCGMDLHAVAYRAD